MASFPNRFFLWLCLILASATLINADYWIPDRTPRCGTRGIRLRPSYIKFRQAGVLSVHQCGALCLATSKCRSFSLTKRTCRLYAHSDVITPLFRYFTFWDKACATNRLLCNIRGHPKNRPIKEYPPSMLDSSYTGCHKRCADDFRCASFSLGPSRRCKLYRHSIPTNLRVELPGQESYWDLGCEFVIDGYPAFRKPIFFDDGPHSKSIESPVNSPTIKEYVPLMLDSPPYVATERPKPHGGFASDDELVRWHNFTQFELPPLAAEGEAPVPDEAGPQPAVKPGPCIASTGPQALFTLVSQDFTPIVWRAGHGQEQHNHLTPLQPPPVPPGATDPLSGVDPTRMKLDLFYLQAPANPDAPAGIYDMVLAGPEPHFVAMERNGIFVIVNAGATGEVTSGLATSIFRLNCEGQITIEVDGRPFSWAQASENRVQALAGNDAHSHFKAIPADHPVVAKAHGDDVNQPAGIVYEPTTRVDIAPKCPTAPGGLEPRRRKRSMPHLGNICSNTAHLWRPGPFNFTEACETQSQCYDYCQGYSWQKCNDAFLAKAVDFCFSKWAKTHYDIVALMSCLNQAKYYAIYLGSRPGKELFYRAQKGMCTCSCDATPTTATCSLMHRFYCADIQAENDANCGACGRKCGFGSVCRHGRCACPGNQCGLSCVDLRDNPSHCGRCGTVCKSGYCLEGTCYEPRLNGTETGPSNGSAVSMSPARHTVT